MTAIGTTIIGIDCAVDPKKRGVAVGRFDGTYCTISLPDIAGTNAEIASVVSKCVQETQQVLIAIDAPLGWPTSLGTSLANHRAGDPLLEVSNNLFRRTTDQFIKLTIGQQPLDVGADRIARTAHAALEILGAVGTPIPLAWDSSFTGCAAIEVYPAATLKACGLPSSGYKEKRQETTRREITAGLRQWLQVPAQIESALDNADILDAIVCVLAGLDFLRGEAYHPPKDTPAKKEGWIWVRQRADYTLNLDF